MNRSYADYTKKSNRFDSFLWYRGDSRRAARSHFHRLRNGSSREVRKDCRERERWCARITTRPSGDVSPGGPTSGSLPAISFKLTLLVEGPPRFRDRLRFPHFQPSFSFVTLAWKLFSRSLSVGRKKQSVNGSRSSSLYRKASLQICFCSQKD